MRGIILAGGTGSRLLPLTKSINKHLLPVGGKPMIHWPLKVLRDNGIEDITIVSSPDGVGQIAKAMGGGSEFGCRFTYRVQDQPGGIAQALACASDETNEDVAVILGDNMFAETPKFAGVKWESSCCFVYKIDDPKVLKNFGVAVVGDNRVVEIVEKPLVPPSRLAVIGLYLFVESGRHYLQSVLPGERGEMEMTDLLNIYAANGLLSHHVVRGFWGDAGTHEGLRQCNEAAWAWEEEK